MGLLTCTGCKRILNESEFRFRSDGDRERYVRRCRKCEAEKGKHDNRRKKSVGGNWLFLGCVHMPFQHPDMIDWLKKINDEHLFTRVFCLGDLYDWAGLNRFMKDPNMPSPQEEYQASLPIREQLYSLFGEVDMVWGNHDLRVMSRAAEAYIPEFFFKDLREVYGMPESWKTQGGYLEVTHPHLGDMVLLHGDKISKDAVLNAQSFGKHVIMADRHTVCKVEWRHTLLNRRLFGVNSGCLVDSNHRAFNYGKGRRLRSVVGVSAIINGSPQNIVMPLDDDGRWLER